MKGWLLSLRARVATPSHMAADTNRFLIWSDLNKIGDVVFIEKIHEYYNRKSVLSFSFLRERKKVGDIEHFVRTETKELNSLIRVLQYYLWRFFYDFYIVNSLCIVMVEFVIIDYNIFEHTVGNFLFLFMFIMLF